MEVKYVDTQSQLADILTKVFSTKDGTRYSTCATSWMYRLSLIIISAFFRFDESRDMSKLEVQGEDNARCVTKSRKVRKMAFYRSHRGHQDSVILQL